MRGRLVLRVVKKICFKEIVEDWKRRRIVIEKEFYVGWDYGLSEKEKRMTKKKEVLKEPSWNLIPVSKYSKMELVEELCSLYNEMRFAKEKLSLLNYKFQEYQEQCSCTPCGVCGLKMTSWRKFWK